MAKRNTTVKEYCPTCCDMVEAVVIDDFENAVCEICGSQTKDVRNTCGGGGSDDYSPTFGAFRNVHPIGILTPADKALLATCITTDEMKPSTKSRIITYTVGEDEETAPAPARRPTPREGSGNSKYEYPADCNTPELRKAYRARARKTARAAAAKA